MRGIILGGGVITIWRLLVFGGGVCSIGACCSWRLVCISIRCLEGIDLFFRPRFCRFRCIVAILSIFIHLLRFLGYLVTCLCLVLSICLHLIFFEVRLGLIYEVQECS